MKTKRVTFYIDLPWGWQDSQPLCGLYAYTSTTIGGKGVMMRDDEKFQRVAFDVDLPHFGGAEVHAGTAVVREEK